MQNFVQQCENGAIRLMKHLPWYDAFFRRERTLRGFFYLSILFLSFISFAVAYSITSTYYSHSLRGHLTDIADGYFRHVSASILDVMKMKAGCNPADMRHVLEMPSVVEQDVFKATLEKAPIVGGTGTFTPMAGKAFATKNVQGQWNHAVLTRAYPLKAESTCLSCHKDVQLGDVLAVVTVTADMSRRMQETEYHIYLLFLVLLPVPLLLSFFLAVFLHSKVSRSLKQLDTRIRAVNSVQDLSNLADDAVFQAGFSELNQILAEFNTLANRVRGIAVDKEILEFELQVLEKFILTSEVVRDWREHVKSLLVEMNRILDVAALFSLFQVDNDRFDLEIFWLAQPASEQQQKQFEELVVQRAVSFNPRLQGGVGIEVKHNVADSDSRLPEMEVDGMALHLKALVLQDPKIGGVVGIGLHSMAPADDIRTLVIESILTTLLNVVGSIKAIGKYTHELEYYATRDPLTNLYNQRLFWELIGYEKGRADRHDYCFSLLVIDLDNFKHVNDTYGHVFGDRMLIQVADTIKQCLRQGDILARYGGDEFVVLLPDSDREHGYAAAQRISAALSGFSLLANDGIPVKTSGSIGIAVYPDHAQSVKDLFVMADNVMYKAKGSGKNTICMPTEEDIAEVYQKIGEQTVVIRNAVDDGLILPYFQPIIATADHSVFGYEILSRIEYAGEIMPAGTFIEVAERLGLITRLDLVLMENLFTRIADTGYDGYIFINLSPKSFIVQEYVPSLLKLSKRFNIKRSNIVFEITERDTVKNVSLIEKFVNILKSEGYQFAVDDFGSGFSSFQYIKRLPIDFVKIEGEFVKNMCQDERDQFFVRTMAQLATEFGIRSIAEFVENEEIYQLVGANGVDFAQGYHLGPPAPRMRGV